VEFYAFYALGVLFSVMSVCVKVTRRGNAACRTLAGQFAQGMCVLACGSKKR
jgi:hypothetical protein